MTLLITEVPTDWSSIWSITLVSFGLVLVILFLLVYVMKIFGLFFKDKSKASANAETTSVKAEGKSGSDEEVVAAIATAIALAQGALHVEESGVLTFGKDRQTAWNNKAYGITRMPEHIH